MFSFQYYNVKMSAEHSNRPPELYSEDDIKMFDMLEEAKERLDNTLAAWPEFQEAERKNHAGGIIVKFDKNDKKYTYFTVSGMFIQNNLVSDMERLYLEVKENGEFEKLEFISMSNGDAQTYTAVVNYDEYFKVPVLENEAGFERRPNAIHGSDHTQWKETDNKNWNPLSKDSPGMKFAEEMMEKLKTI
jgi:hypothetical protein